MPFEIRVPMLGESVTEATVARWLKPVGSPVKANDVVVELGTDKVNVEVFSPSDGLLERVDHQEGDTVHVNDLLGVIAEGAVTAPTASLTAAAAPAVTSTTPAPAAADNGRAHATPVAARLADERRVDLAAVPGSGPGGKVLKGDVETFLARGASATPVPPVPAPAPVQASAPTAAPSAPAAVGSASAAAAPSAARPSSDGREERRPMSRRRLTIAERLVAAQHTAAMLTTFNEVDMSAIMEVRKRRRDAFKERHGVGLGFMSFFTKACVGALKAFPLLNAEIQGSEIVVKRYYDIGIAVAADEGLVVPVVRGVDRKTFAQIEREIADLAGRARENRLTLPELMGGTFTVTNGGVFGSLLSTPILNAPQVGILGMHKIQERPVALEGQVVIRPMMYLALSYDHRIVDGSEAVRFLVRIKELVEDPESLLLEG